jgi:2-hydroxy-3-oxopropionate reductase
MKAGFIGTGSIGTPMAIRLLDSVDELVVFDARPEAMATVIDRGAVAATSARDVADRTDVVFLSLPTKESFRTASTGPQGCIHGNRAKIIANTSTMGMPCVTQVAEALEQRGMRMVDCPISGGIIGATQGTLSVMVSGRPEAIDAIRPLLMRFGTITVAGDAPGAAQVLKLTNNILSIVGTGRNSATVSKFPVSVLDRSFRFGSTIEILMKDADLAIEQGEALGVPMWVCQAARLVYKHAVFKGAARDDVTTIVQHIERAAGFELPKTR